LAVREACRYANVADIDYREATKGSNTGVRAARDFTNFGGFRVARDE
jgi:hypothetical protein